MTPRFGREFVADLASRLKDRIQLTSDGWQLYREAVDRAFSKRIENHQHAIALHYFHYNFIRKHQTIKTTPAVMAGVADRARTMVDFVKLLEREETIHNGRITDYKPAASKKV